MKCARGETVVAIATACIPWMEADMLRIKLNTDDWWTLDRAVDYHTSHEGEITAVDDHGVKVGSVAAGQWVYVELPAET